MDSTLRLVVLLLGGLRLDVSRVLNDRRVDAEPIPLDCVMVLARVNTVLGTLLDEVSDMEGVKS